MPALHLEGASLSDSLEALREQLHQVQQLIQDAPRCPDFLDLHTTLIQAIEELGVAQSEEYQQSMCSPERPFAVACSPPPLDFSALQPDKVEGHIAALKMRAALLGVGPPAWAINAQCIILRPPELAHLRVIIKHVTPEGNFVVHRLHAPGAFCAQLEAASLQLIPPQAGAFWRPKEQPPYDPDLPPYSRTYTEEEKAAQREAGQKQTEALQVALQEGCPSYTFPPGIYRISDKLNLEGSTDFTLVLADVELISEKPELGFFRCYENTNLTVRGPVALDAEPFQIAQCCITRVDAEACTLEVQVMAGYADPHVQGRVLVFSREGGRFPTWQTYAQAVDSLGGGHFAMRFDPDFMKIPGLAQAGNFLTVEARINGVELRKNDGVTFEQVCAYGCGMVWGNPEYGDNRFTMWRSMRRPGTNRLFSGGSVFQITYRGGSFFMDRSEVSYNQDDLSDLFGLSGYTAPGAGDGAQIWACAGLQWLARWELVFYDAHSLQELGRARIAHCADCSGDCGEDQGALKAIDEALVAAGLRGDQEVSNLRRIKLDQPVHLPRLTLIGCTEAAPQKICITNSYFHDGLNTGIAAKGSIETLVANNWVERTTNACIGVSEDHWWWEGCMAGDVVIRNNTVRDAHYRVGGDGPSITVHATGVDEKPSGCPIRSVAVVGNLVLDPPGVPIEVSQAANVFIYGNLPMAHDPKGAAIDTA